MPARTRNQSPVLRVAPYSVSAEQYDKLLARPMLPILAGNFMRATRSLNLAGSSIADVGCGSGRLVYFLEDLGLNVTGVDNSAAMLELARRRNLGRRACFLLQDLRALKLPQPVDIITCHFDTLNYMLHLADLQIAFRQLSANLLQGGCLLFDMIILPARKMTSMVRQFSVQMPHCVTSWLINTTVNGIRSARLDTRCRDTSGAFHTTRELHIQRAWPVSIILHCLRKAGLKLLSMRDACMPGEPRLFFEAQRIKGCTGV